jgi:hypothetical protein
MIFVNESMLKPRGTPNRLSSSSPHICTNHSITDDKPAEVDTHIIVTHGLVTPAMGCWITSTMGARLSSVNLLSILSARV